MKNITSSSKLKPKRLSPEDILSEVRGEKYNQKEMDHKNKMENDLLIINNKILYLQGQEQQQQQQMNTSSPFVTQIRTIVNESDKSKTTLPHSYISPSSTLFRFHLFHICFSPSTLVIN